MKKTTHTVTLKPRIDFELEYQIMARSQQEATTKAEAHFIKTICQTFGFDPKNAHIKFKDK